jgi:site-specific DNA-methyltransferase (cytosine-N4-specific)
MAKLAATTVATAPEAPTRKRKSVVIGYKTTRGTMFQGKIEAFLQSPRAAKYAGKVQLIFTSPPFPLNRKKAYGNEQGEAFCRWLGALAPELRKLLTPKQLRVLCSP